MHRFKKTVILQSLPVEKRPSQNLPWQKSYLLLFKNSGKKQ
jgi:hypothetical protein